jgi:predicted Na+-dependent transporter
MELIYLSNSLLFLLMFINSLTIDSSQLFRFSNARIKSSVLFLALLFIILPCILINLAQMLLSDSNYLLGYAFSCLAPTAFVAPFFCKLRKADVEDSILHIFLSTLFFPVASFLFLKYLLPEEHFVDIPSIMSLLLLITFLPMGLGLCVPRVLPRIKIWLAPKSGFFNSIILGILMFILCGSSFNKLRLSHLFEQDIVLVIALLLFLDFGVYFLMKFFSNSFVPKKSAESLAISVSLHNLALPAGLLLSFQPKAAIVPALGLVIHAFFFQWLAHRKN